MDEPKSERDISTNHKMNRIQAFIETLPQPLHAKVRSVLDLGTVCENGSPPDITMRLWDYGGGIQFEWGKYWSGKGASIAEAVEDLYKKSAENARYAINEQREQATRHRRTASSYTEELNDRGKIKRKLEDEEKRVIELNRLISRSYDSAHGHEERAKQMEEAIAKSR